MNKVKMNYLLDMVIGLAFLVAALTGIAFLFLGSGGYQGGHNPTFQTVFLGISREVWSDLHTLGALVMIAGVGVHLVMHWKWIVCVTKQMLPKLPAPRRHQEECPVS